MRIKVKHKHNKAKSRFNTFVPFDFNIKWRKRNRACTATIRL